MFSKIAAGDHVTCGIEKDKTEVYCWGDNSNGQLGLGATAPVSEKPVKILKAADSALDHVLDVYTDYNAVCVRIDNQGPSCWGTTPYVRTEKVNEKEERVIGQLIKEKTPTKLNSGPATAEVVKEYGGPWVDNSTSNLVILKDDVCSLTGRNIRCIKAKLDVESALHLTGKNSTLFYSLPPGTEGYEVSQWDLVSGKGTIVSGLPADLSLVAAGTFHACANFGSDGGYCWTTGAQNGNKYGQLGFKGEAETLSPYQMPYVVKMVSSGARHSCAVKQDGTVWCWGSDDQGQTGAEPRWTPSNMQRPQKKNDPVGDTTSLE